jgi:hypothetical protein
MEGSATIDEKPTTLYLNNARNPSRSSTPHPDQMGLPPFTPALPGMYGGHAPLPPPMWGYQGHYFGMPPPVMNPMPTLGTVPNVATITIPDIVSWFSYLDRHEQRNKDGIIFAPYGVTLKAKGFLRLSQLTLEFIQLKDLQEWLGIEVGTAILIMQYAKEDMDALKTSQWVFPTNLS